MECENCEIAASSNLSRLYVTVLGDLLGGVATNASPGSAHIPSNKRDRQSMYTSCPLLWYRDRFTPYRMKKRENVYRRFIEVQLTRFEATLL